MYNSEGGQRGSEMQRKENDKKVFGAEEEARRLNVVCFLLGCASLSCSWKCLFHGAALMLTLTTRSV